MNTYSHLTSRSRTSHQKDLTNEPEHQTDDCRKGTQIFLNEKFVFVIENGTCAEHEMNRVEATPRE
jgi:hypothetical protein